MSSEERLPGVDIPTLKEQGLDVAFFNWRGLFAPPDIRAADLEALETAITGMAESQAWKDTVDAAAVDRPLPAGSRVRDLPEGGPGRDGGYSHRPRLGEVIS